MVSSRKPTQVESRIKQELKAEMATAISNFASTIRGADLLGSGAKVGFRLGKIEVQTKDGLYTVLVNKSFKSVL